MEKTLTIDGRQVRFRATGAFFLIYKAQFGRDGLADMLGMWGELSETAEQAVETVDASPSAQQAMLDVLDMEILYNMVWTLAKAADETIPDPLTWLNEFSEFPLEHVMGELQELLQKSMVGSKKKKAPAAPGGRKSPPLTTELLLVRAIGRGLQLSDFAQMTFGMILDYCSEYDEEMRRAGRRQTRGREQPEAEVRRATQADFDRFTTGR